MKIKILVGSLICLFLISCTTAGPKNIYTTDLSTGDVIVPVNYVGGLDTLNKKTKGNLFITNSTTKFVSEKGIVHFSFPTSSIRGVYVGDDVKLHLGKTLARSLLIGPFALFIKDKAEVISIEFTEKEKDLVINPIFQIKAGTGSMLKKNIHVKQRFASAKMHWETARTANTISAYEKFLMRHSDSEFVDEARSRLKKLYAEREWKNAKTSNNISAYEEFLRKHPDSEFAGEAHLRLNSLKKLKPQDNWEDALSADTISAYEQFIKTHPDSKYAMEARSRLNLLQTERKQRDEKKHEIFEEWQTNPEAFVKLFYGDDLSKRSPRKEITYLRDSKKSMIEKVEGAYVEWPVTFGIWPIWLLCPEERRIREGWNNLGLFYVIGPGFSGWMDLMGCYRQEGTKKINWEQMTWGIPPQSSVLVKMKIEWVSPSIWKNGILETYVRGSDVEIETSSKKCDWPEYDTEIYASIPIGNFPASNSFVVLVSSELEFAVKVGLRSEDKGKDFIVPKKGAASIRVPRGEYDIYFQYAADPESLYQGESFNVTGSGIQIQLKSTEAGGYKLRKIK